MKNKLSQNVTYWLGVVAIGLVVGLSLQFVRAWTEPSVAPPGGNVGAPINTGDIGQSKEGNLIIATNPNLPGGGLKANGLIVQNGNVGIGTTSPGTNKLQVNGKIQAVGGDICTDQGGGKCLSAAGGGGIDSSSAWGGLKWVPNLTQISCSYSYSKHYARVNNGRIELKAESYDNSGNTMLRNSTGWVSSSVVSVVAGTTPRETRLIPEGICGYPVEGDCGCRASW